MGLFIHDSKRSIIHRVIFVNINGSGDRTEDGGNVRYAVSLVIRCFKFNSSYAKKDFSDVCFVRIINGKTDLCKIYVL